MSYAADADVVHLSEVQNWSVWQRFSTNAAAMLSPLL
jgi:hypothetical protein